MESWRTGYLGIRQVLRDLSEFELNTFYNFSKQEIALIETRRSDLYRLAVALHVGFIRMSGRSLDSDRQIPAMLWRHLGRQLHVQPPDLGTLRSICDGRLDTLSDVFGARAAGFRVFGTAGTPSSATGLAAVLRFVAGFASHCPWKGLPLAPP